MINTTICIYRCNRSANLREDRSTVGTLTLFSVKDETLLNIWIFQKSVSSLVADALVQLSTVVILLPGVVSLNGIYNYKFLQQHLPSYHYVLWTRSSRIKFDIFWILSFKLPQLLVVISILPFLILILQYLHYNHDPSTVYCLPLLCLQKMAILFSLQIVLQI